MKSLFVLLFLFSVCWANEVEITPFNFELVTGYEKLAEPVPTPHVNPGGVVHGVNVITGTHLDLTEDFATKGIDPLSFVRSYFKNEPSLARYLAIDGPNFGGWFFNYNYLLFIDRKKGKDAALAELSGGTLTYKIHSSNQYYRVDLENDGKGVTNSGNGILSGQNHLKNNTIFHDGTGYTARTGEGRERLFRESEKTRYSPQLGIFYLAEEKKPSGNRVKYVYDADSRLTEIKTTDASGNKVLNWMRFHYGAHLTIENSDGKQFHYHLKRITNSGLMERYLLDRVIRPDGTEIKYSYYVHNKDVWKRDYLWGIALPEGRSVNVTYPQGANPNPKVSQIRAPMGTDPAHLALYTFEYGAGYTIVRDASQTPTIYRYNAQERIIAIERYNLGKLHSIERNLWEGPNLIVKTLEDALGRVFLCRTFTYDERGNVLSEKLYGNLTGRGAETITMLSNGSPDEIKCDCYIKHYRYSQEGLNLLLFETDGVGSTSYSYKPGTNLLTSKLVCDGSKISLRNFREYDEIGAVIKTVEDDGKSRDSNDVSGCTERRIKRIVPRQSAPGIGQPEIEEELFFDFETQKEILLKRTIFHYSSTNDCVQKDLYDARGRFAYSLKFTFDAMGRPLSQTDPEGNAIQMRYDSNGNLVKKIGPRPDQWTEYTYDYRNQLICVCQNGRFIRYRYDAIGNKIAEQDPSGNEITFAYDSLGNVTQITYPSTLDGNGTSIKASISKRYDIANNVVEVIDERGDRKHTSYNIRGQPTRIEHLSADMELGEERLEYDLRGNLRQKIARNGRRTIYTYDFLDRLVKTEHSSSNDEYLSETSARYSAFHLLEEIDPEGFATRYRYDGVGREKSLSREISGKETTLTEKEYDERGNLSLVKDWSGDNYTSKRFLFDLCGRVIEERTEDGLGNCFEKQQYRYDASGNRTHLIRFPNGEAITFTLHDPFGRIQENIDPCGNTTRYYYDDCVANGRGQMVFQSKKIDPQGKTTITLCDARGRVEKILESATSGNLLSSVEYRYDGVGNRVLECSNDITHRFTFGPFHLLYKMTEEENRPPARHTFFRYDRAGQLVHKECGGQSFHYSYDPFGRIAEMKADDVAYAYEYNRRGELVRLRNGARATERFYDGCGNLLKEIQESGFAITYTYDKQGRRTAMYLPDQSWIAYRYLGPRLAAIERYSKEGERLYSHNYLSTTLSGRVLEVKMIGNAGNAGYSYDSLGRLRSIQTPTWSQSILEGGYDPAGNLLSFVTKDESGVHEERFSYDGLYQLISENDHNYSYDSLYNRREKDGKATTIGKYNQLLRDASGEYVWDAHGNLREIWGKEKSLCFYDALSHLQKFQNEKNTVDYAYDGLHRRVAKKAKDRSKDFYLYDGQEEIARVDAQGNILDLRVLGVGQDKTQAVAIELKGIVYAAVHDQRGNLACLVETITGEIVESYVYTAFGEEKIFNEKSELQNQSQFQVPWRFAGRRTDEETGWVAFGRRYYSPSMGRWTTQDPLGYADGRNLYAFVHNNPLIHFDLFGLKSERISALSEARNCIEFFYAVGRLAFSVIEWIGKNMIPLPGIRDGIEAVGRWGSGGRLFQLSEWRSSLTEAIYLPGKQVLGEMGIYTNGMRTTREECLEAALALQEALGGVEMYAVYNSTHGFLTDLIESVLGKLGFNFMPEKRTYELIQELHQSDSGLKFNMWAHSQGGLHVYNTGKHLPEHVRSLIEVTTFGSAKLIPNGFFRESINIVSSIDIVPMTDIVAYSKAVLGAGSNVTFVSPSSLNPFKEHRIMGETYQKIIIEMGKEYQKAQGYP